MKKKNLLLGAFDNYEWDTIKYWVNSIKQTGSDCDIVVVVFNTSFETVQKLLDNDVKIIAMNKDEANQRYTYQSKIPIHVERFFHFYNILKDNYRNYDKVLITDMKDVIFQTNPFQYINKKFKECDGYVTEETIICGSECLKYKDEEWGKLNYTMCFGDYFYEEIKDKTIMNVGVFGGHSYAVTQLCQAILLGSINRPIPIVDQAVFNQLVHNHGWYMMTCQCNMNEGFVVHLGTVADPLKMDKFRPLLLEEEPILDLQNELVKVNGEDKNGDINVIVSSIVHQWDRVPDLVPVIERKYG